MNSRLSVIIPYYDNAATLPRCLSSLPEGAEVIVVDDGSHEPVETGHAPSLTLKIIHTPHRGAGAARNRGMAEATGDYLWFVDADDYLQLHSPLSTLHSTPCDLFKMGPLVSKPQNLETSKPKREGTLDHTTYLFRREFLLEHGLKYPEEMPLLEDSVFVLRCLSCNPVIEKDLSLRPYHITQRTTTAGRWNREKRRRFRPAILRFFREFKAFVKEHPEYRKLYNRYAYVYARVWVVKLLPRVPIRGHRCVALGETRGDAPHPENYSVRSSRKNRFAEMVKLAELEEKNRQREAALQDFADKVYEALGLETIVVKGSSLARYWPEPLLRECVDNDLYFGPDAPRVDEWVRSQGIEVDGKDPRHSSFFWQGVSFENHAYLLYPQRPGDTSQEPHWQTQPWRPHLRVLTPAYEALFVAAHMEHDALFHEMPITPRKLDDWRYLWPHVDPNELKQIQFNRFPDLLTSYLFPEQSSVSASALETFHELYLRPHPRYKWALRRVLVRSLRYIKYRKVYREIQGASPFKLFYINNLKTALKNFTLHPSPSTL